MRLGISPFASTRAGALRIAARAAEGGLTLWLGDGLLINADFPMWSGGMETFTELAWLSGRFPDTPIGMSAAVLPLRYVTWVAKQAASLDQLTEGRFTLVVAPGFWEREFTWRGLSFGERGTLFRDAVDELRTAWTAGALSPPPFTPGGPPLWLAGGPATMRRALDLGLPYQPSRLTAAELAPIARQWFDRGGGQLAVRVRMEVLDATPGVEVAWNTISGPPARLAEELLAYQALGVDDVSIVPGQGDDSALRTVDALVTHVAPRLAN